MATTYERQKDGKFKITKRTGFDAVAFKFGNTLEKIKSGAKKGAKKVVDSALSGMDRHHKAQSAKELDDVERAFGTVENYVKFNPDYAARAKKLRKDAGR